MTLLDLIFPKTCLGCGTAGRYICRTCLDKLRPLSSVCPYCERDSPNGVTHSKCGNSFGLDGLTSVWDYEGIVKKAILAFKFKYATEVGRELTGILVHELLAKDVPIVSPVLVPVPIHWHRENVRGFNQSEEIGKTIAESLGWGFVRDLIEKKKPTVSQVEVSVEERKRNLKGVFSVPSNVEIEKYPNIILFDDVFTTGSTLKEAAKVLKKSGVQKVWGLTVAR